MCRGTNTNLQERKLCRVLQYKQRQESREQPNDYSCSHLTHHWLSVLVYVLGEVGLLG